MALMGLRDELRSIRGGDVADASPHSFPALTALATAVERRLPRVSYLGPEDLAGSFLLEMVESQAPGTDPHPLDDLRALDDEHLRVAVRNRLRQLGLANRTRWNIVRALRRQVARALTNLPATPDHPPPSLQTGKAGKLSQACVADAVAWLLAQRETPKQSTPTLSNELQRMYFPQRQELPSLDVAATDWAGGAETAALRLLDGANYLDGLRALYSEKKIEVSLRWLEGQRYQDIASDARIGLATAFAWVREVCEGLKRLVRDRYPSANILHSIVQAAAEERGRRSRPR